MIIQFEDFTLNLFSGDLSRNNRLISLKPQPTKLLLALASQPGALVTREQIRKQIWLREVFVDYENGINACVRQLRRALADDSRHSRYIQTESRRGYRFIAEVKALDSSAVAAATPALPRLVLPHSFGRRASDAAIKLQVMPLRIISDSEEVLHLAEGLSEELVIQLANTCGKGIAVIDDLRDATTANSTYILKGAVRKEGTRLRVTVRVVKACDHQVIGAETVEREVGSVLDVQLELAKTLAQSVYGFTARF